MRLLDVNLLVYATLTIYPVHNKARAWLDGQINSDKRLAIPWETALGFVRVASNTRFHRPCLTVRQAWAQMQRWLDCPNVWIPGPSPDHREIIGRLLSASGLTHKHVADAQLAALAIGHGLILSSADSDFMRFPGLRYENPLLGQ